MARSSLHLILDQKTPINLENKSGRALVRKVIRHLEGALGGSVQASHLTTWVDGAQPTAAQAVITCANVTAADTVTIGKQVLTAVSGATANDEFDMSGNATAEATSLALAINSSTTAAMKAFEASNLTQTITLATCTAGTRISIAGHEFQAVAAAANVLTNGDFSISGNDTADATALVNAINAHPVLAHQVFATSSAGAVTVRQRRGTSSLGKLLITNNGSGVTLGGANFTASADVLISLKHEGIVGNQVPVATSNGTRLAILGSATSFSGGAGEGVTPVRVVMGGSAQ